MYPERPLSTLFPSLATTLLKGLELTNSAGLNKKLDKVLNLKT